MNTMSRIGKRTGCAVILTATCLFGLIGLAYAGERKDHPTTSWSCRPQPGDVFREYCWIHNGGDAGGSLRVGGRLDYGGGPITIPHQLVPERGMAQITVTPC